MSIQKFNEGEILLILLDLPAPYVFLLLHSIFVTFPLFALILFELACRKGTAERLSKRGKI